MISTRMIITFITYTKNYPQPNPSKPKYYKLQITHQIRNQIFCKKKQYENHLKLQQHNNATTLK